MTAALLPVLRMLLTVSVAPSASVKSLAPLTCSVVNVLVGCAVIGPVN